LCSGYRVPCMIVFTTTQHKKSIQHKECALQRRLEDH